MRTTAWCWPERSNSGALLVFRADDPAEVERFVQNEPYVTQGLVPRWRIQEWAVVVGEHAVPR